MIDGTELRAEQLFVLGDAHPGADRIERYAEAEPAPMAERERHRLQRGLAGGFGVDQGDYLI
ncbi:hypothetical protein [Sphingomonas sp. dw_22]|uniref:hypothetical protein n=1 Tax=Sphingomonas sp. dw_22 TaxID=2721175 RepID=UPI001BD2B39E|nr:hypothetical protein [Sphingomonas sp. dw_22]